MKTQLIFSALILFTAALPKASAQSAEEQAIKEAIASETKYYLMADSISWQAAWLHDAKVTHTWASSDSYGVMIGWDSVKRRVIRSMVLNGPRDTTQLKNENYLVRVNGNLATVDFDQVSGDGSDSSRYVARSHRILVKENGKWKIASVSGYVSSSWAANGDNSENNLNSAGYSLLTRKRIEDAVDVFKLNVKLHPNSWNCYDSLGEAYAIGGKKELAIENYEKSISLNPKNENGKAALAKLGRR
jgi:tetratricopeptide (TPR) repeat protein